jgi:glycosyltransferase involved in cell wall biosynthesis
VRPWLAWLQRTAPAVPREAPRPVAPLRLLVVADRLGPTQYISFIRPFAQRIRDGACLVEFLDEAAVIARLAEGGRAALREHLANRLDWLTPLALCFSRYSGPCSALMQSLARARGVPLMGHLDDDLFEVPESVGAKKHGYYNDPVRQENLRATMAGCDLIYASTATLAQRLRDRGFAPRVVAGGIYCSAEPLAASQRRTPSGPGRTVGYMGTSGHAGDLDLVVPTLVRLLERRPELRVEMFGTIRLPPSLTRFGPRAVQRPAVPDYEAFLARLGSLEWDVGLAPLCENRFNACKADTKWVEYAAAGIPVAASDRLVYQRVGAAGAAALVPDDGWEGTLTALLDEPERRSSLCERASSVLATDYTPSRLEAQVLDVLAAVGVSP